LKANELKDIQQELVDQRHKSDEHIHDLSTKLKTITDRHREATTSLNNDIRTKKQQIEQYAQQIEQHHNDLTQWENERSELQRQVDSIGIPMNMLFIVRHEFQCRVKDNINTDLELQIRNLQRDASINVQSAVVMSTVEPNVTRIEYDKLDQELQSIQKRYDQMTIDVRRFQCNIRYVVVLVAKQRYVDQST
jgi:chromosome segregation ATPase